MAQKTKKPAEIKTKETSGSVQDFIRSLRNEQKESDSLVLIEIMKRASKEEPKMWGSSLIGFGKKRYKSPSGREVDWFLIGFSPRKANFSLYLMINHKDHEEALGSLGKYKTGGGCIYINKLADINLKVLKELVTASIKAGKQKQD